MLTMENTSRLQSPRGIKRIVAPTFLAVEVASLKLHGRIDADDENVLIADYIEAATNFVESQQNRCLRLSTWQAVYDSFPPDGVFYIDNPPLVALVTDDDYDGITYVDSDGDTQVLAAASYVVDAISQPGRVALAYGQVWPTIRSQIGSIVLTYTAGYATAAEIRATTRQAIRVLAQHLYEFREPIVTGTIVAAVPMSVMDMIHEDKLMAYR